MMGDEDLDSSASGDTSCVCDPTQPTIPAPPAPPIPPCFMNLPLELRGKVYEHLAAQDPLPLSGPRQMAPSLLMVNKQVSKEYTDASRFHRVFYADFTIPWDVFAPLLAWIDRLEAEERRSRVRMTIVFGAEFGRHGWKCIAPKYWRRVGPAFRELNQLVSEEPRLLGGGLVLELHPSVQGRWRRRKVERKLAKRLAAFERAREQGREMRNDSSNIDGRSTVP